MAFLVLRRVCLDSNRDVGQNQMCHFVRLAFRFFFLSVYCCSVGRNRFATNGRRLCDGLLLHSRLLDDLAQWPDTRYPCLVKKWAVGSSSGQFVTLEPYRSNLNYFKHFKILFSFFIRPIRVICDLFFHLFNQTHKILCFFIRQIRVNCVPFFTHSIKPTKILSPFIRQIRVIRVPFFLPNNQTY